MGGSSTQKNPDGSGNPNGPFSWNGASTPTNFDPKTLGTTLFSDLNRAINQGPQVDPTSSYNPLSAQTQAGIQSGIAQTGAANSGSLANYASGQYLNDSDDPYFAANLALSNNNATQAVNSTFNADGQFGSQLHAQGLGTAIANTDNQAYQSQLQNEFSNMLGAQGQMNNNTAQGLGYSSLIDQNNAQKIAAQQQQWQQAQPINWIGNALGMLEGGSQSSNANTLTNQPINLANLLGTGANILGSLLKI